jgi:UDP-N-acetylglucosamine:LPS N-acetylglucosamine transferase
MQMLWPVFADHDCVLVSYRCRRTERLSFVQKKYLLDDIGTNVVRMVRAFAQAARILLVERPDVVLSTGAEIAIPFLWVGKLLGANTAYIESWSRAQTRSGTGPLVYPIADLFLVQWPALLELYGPKARYEGGLA